jgi:hexosaminidase
MSTWGGLHGVTTLWQLVSNGAHPGPWQIQDAPRFAWRGLLIDVARHFISREVLQRVIDGMAKLKMNVLHLHLTDDQAFRFASAAFPGLASEQCYSTTELQQLVHYAADRGIRMVPELDVPGHVNSWLVHYPQWGSHGAQPTIKFGVHDACLDPTSEAVYDALDVLFAELAEVFPDAYVHIGGDEVRSRWWSEDEDIQRYMAAHDLADDRALQAHFNVRVCEQLARHGKRVLGWDEVLHPQMPDLLVQNWRGASTRDRALARSLDCIVSAGYYLDLMYPADIYYGYDPEAPQQDLFAYEDSVASDERLEHIAAGLAWTLQWRDGAIELPASADFGQVVGGEACLWSELVDDASLEVRLFSRLPAVAERLWSPAQVVDVEDFYRRLQWVLTLPGLRVAETQRARLAQIGLSAQQIELASLLEPVKWYARLLGQQALQARIGGAEMPQARPYDTTTPLTRIIDCIAPESLAARELAELDTAGMRERSQVWTQLDTTDWPPDARDAISGMIAVGRAMLAAMDASVALDRSIAELADLYQPRGEYILAVIPVLSKWLKTRA